NGPKNSSRKMRSPDLPGPAAMPAPKLTKKYNNNVRHAQPHPMAILSLPTTNCRRVESPGRVRGGFMTWLCKVASLTQPLQREFDVRFESSSQISSLRRDRDPFQRSQMEDEAALLAVSKGGLAPSLRGA